MLKGICLDKSDTTVLEEGKTYFLFPNGEQHFYVSNFPREGSHKGCFRSELFYIIREDSAPVEPPMHGINLDKTKVYKGELIYSTWSGTPLKEYYIRPQTTHGCAYEDPQLKNLRGSFPLHWFDGIQEVTEHDLNQTMHEFIISDPKQSRVHHLRAGIQEFHKQNKSEEECLEYIRDIAPTIKRYLDNESGQVGFYSFSCEEGELQVFKGNKVVDLYKAEQLSIDDFLFV